MNKNKVALLASMLTVSGGLDFMHGGSKDDFSYSPSPICKKTIGLGLTPQQKKKRDKSKVARKARKKNRK